MLEIRNGRLQPLPQRDVRLPAELLARERDIRLTLARIVGRQRSVHELRARARQVEDRLGQFDHGELAGIAEVDRAGEPLGRLHQAQEALDRVVHVAERAALGAVSVERDRRVLQRLDDEVRRYAAVVRVHARAVRIEDARDLDVHPVLAVVVEEPVAVAGDALRAAVVGAVRVGHGGRRDPSGFRWHSACLAHP